MLCCPGVAKTQFNAMFMIQANGYLLLPVNTMFFFFCPSGFTFCQQVSSRTYTDSTKKTTNQELWDLLSSIQQDTKMSAKERKRLLGQFYQAHPEIFNQFFGESAVNVLQTMTQAHSLHRSVLYSQSHQSLVFAFLNFWLIVGVSDTS